MVRLPEIPVPVAGNPADRLLSLPIEDSVYDGARKCTPKAPRPGMLALQRWLEANARGVFWGSYRCEKWGKGQASLHAENRAIDWHLDVSVPRRRARRREADPAAAGARRRRQPAGARAPDGRRGADLGLRVLGRRDDAVHRVPARATASAASCKRKVNTTVAHRDHVHIGMTKRGAAARTSLLEPGPVIRAILAGCAAPPCSRACSALAVLGGGCAGDRRGRRREDRRSLTGEKPPRPREPGEAAAAAEEAARRASSQPEAGATGAAGAPSPSRTRASTIRARSRRGAGQLRRPRGRPACSRGVGGGGTTKATALSNGVALPPLEAPEAVRQIIEAGNSIARTPYKWGGGHGKWQDTGYDCSGSVSFALAAAGLLDAPLASGPLMSWGKPGQGQVGHDLLQPRPRLPRGRGHPLRHLRPARDGLALAERAAHERGLRRPPSAGPVSRLGVATPSRPPGGAPMKGVQRVPS